MIPLIVLATLVIIPVLLALIFRVHAVFVYLSICAGYFLQFALSDDVDLALATIIRGSNSAVFARLALLVLPVLLTIFMLRKSSGRSLIFQLAPLVLSGLFLASVALPLLPPDVEQGVYDLQYGNGIKSSTDLIVAVASIANLTLAWVLFKSKRDHRKHR